MYKANIEKETRNNKFYRKVVYTGANLQLALMSLKPLEDIPEEAHQGIDQFIRVERGQALVKIDNKKFILRADNALIVPAGKKHYIKNTSRTKDLKLYTLYAPPEHAPETVHKTIEDADASDS